MIEPPHGVTRSTPYPGQPGDDRHPTAGRSRSTHPSWTSSYGEPLPARPTTAPVRQPTGPVSGDHRNAAPVEQPTGPDFGDHRYAALAAWSASAETITMAAVVAGPADAYPSTVVKDQEAGVRHPAVPRVGAAAGDLRSRRVWIAAALAAGVVALAAAMIAVRGRDEPAAPVTTGTRAATTAATHSAGCRHDGKPCP